MQKYYSINDAKYKLKNTFVLSFGINSSQCKYIDIRNETGSARARERDLKHETSLGSDGLGLKNYIFSNWEEEIQTFYLKTRMYSKFLKGVLQYFKK